MARERSRVNPFPMGSAERTLYDHYRKATAVAETKEREAALANTEAKAHRAKAESYAKALRALGHGDKVPGQLAITAMAAVAEG